VQVAVVQHDIVWEAAATTIDRVAPVVARAAADGAGMVVLTEMWSTGFSPEIERIVEPEGGQTSTAMVAWARDLGVWVLGSVCEADPAGGRPRNMALVVGPDGSVARYAKRHLFSYAGEHERMARGRGFLTADCDGIRTTVSICYDLRFAEDFWNRAEDTDLYVVVANWPAPRVHHWRSLLVARAIENQAWVVGANRVGSGGTQSYSGDSLVVDPLGVVVADGAGGEEKVLHAEVDQGVVSEVRARYPFLRDR